MSDGAAYLESHKVQDAIAQAVTKVLKSRPADPITAIGQLLVEAGCPLGKPLLSVGDKFPTSPIVHVGWKKPFSIASLLEGKRKVLWVTLPGGFTPT